MDECAVCLQHDNLYPLECVHRLCLQCAKGVCLHAGRCPLCRHVFSETYKRQVTTAPGTLYDFSESVTDRIAAMFSGRESVPVSSVWAYGDRKNKGCWLYDETTQREIREAESRTEPPRVVYATACGSVVKIDVDARLQVNVATRAVRKLRRFSNEESDIDEKMATIKGIAGMPKAR